MAMSPNSNEVHIYQLKGKDWVKTSVLKEHDKLVTSVDWAPNSNRIVSCSQDRNAYVWTWDGSAWKPTLVILRITRAATQVKWSPKEDKFAVASGHRCISVCYFEEENDWWVSKHIRKPIRSTVLSVDWHPNNVLIACGCADFKARVFSGYIKGVDEKPGPTAWGAKMPFGELMGEFSNGTGGWVHDCVFSPDGESIAWVGHDSSFSVATGGGSPTTIKSSTLPNTCALWLNASSVVVAGHDNQPVLFSNTGGAWKQAKTFDKGSGGQKAASNSSFDKFRQMDTRSQDAATDTELKTVHQNAINQICVKEGAAGAVKSFVTAGVDGKLVTWKV